MGSLAKYIDRRKALRGSVKALAPLALFVASVFGTVLPANATIDNSATVSGTYSSTTTTYGPATASVLVAAPAPSIGVVKTAGAVLDANANGKVDAGDTITYSFTASNLGNVTLTSVGVSDPKVSGITCASTTLAPGANTSCSAAAYVLTQADLDAGQVQNQATVSGTPPTGPVVTDLSDPTTPGPGNNAKTIVALTQAPAIGLVKTAGAIVDVNANGFTDAGDTITYSFTAKNVGTVTLTSVAVTDPKVPSITCTAATLAPGASTNCTAAAPYVLTQADINAGQASNQATASGTPPTGPAVTDLSDPVSPLPGNNNPTVVTFTVTPTIGLLKTVAGTVDVNGNGMLDAGDKVNYAFTVKNTGPVALHNITLTDANATLSGGPLASLAPGASDTTTFTAVHVLTQAEVNAGQLSNQATVTGLSPSNAPITDLSDPVTASAAQNNPTLLPIPSLPKIGVVKTAGAVVDANSNGMTDAGDTITYGFAVSNLGNVTLTSVGVTDPKVPSITCAATTLAPGASTACTAAAPYVLTLADVNAGQVQNQATASGTPPTGAAVTDLSDPTTPGPGSDAKTIVTLTPTAKIGLVKTGVVNDANSNGVTDMGDTITYTFTVSNQGGVTLNPVSVTDPKVSGITCVATSLNPGQSTTCSGNPYALTQTDIDNGVVGNQATASGKPPSGPNVTDLSDPTTPGSANNNPTDIALTQAPAIGIVKTAGTLQDTNGNGQVDAGETITYNFHVTNPGNVTLHLVGVTDPKVGNIICPTTTLAPGQATDCAGDAYVVTQADIDAAVIANQATAFGNTQTGMQVTDLSDPALPGSTHNTVTTTPLTQKSAIGLVKTAGAPVDVNANGLIDAGDTITYTFAVTNLGNTTLSAISVSDPKVSGITCVTTTLAPGQTTSCTGNPYTLLQADIDAGQAQNQATASGTPPTGPPVTDLSDPTTPGPGSNAKTIVNLTPVPQMGLVKAAGAITDANSDGLLDAGDTITYTFVVSNSGNLTLHGIAVTDAKVSPITCPVTTLLPGQSTTCTAPAYVILQNDIDNGQVQNQATVNALTATNAPVSDLSDPTVPGPGANAPTVTNLTPAPALGVVKAAGSIVDANSDGKVDAGDTIAYTFTVTNTGNTKLTSIGVTDPMVPGITCPATTLNPTLSTICTAAPYVLTQADVDAGKVTNQATASGTPPSGPAVTDLSDPTSPLAGKDAKTVTSIPQQEVIGLVKTSGGVVDANSNGVTDVGDTITYSFTAYNLGTVTLTNLAVTDPKLGAITCVATTLAPGATTTCTAPPYSIMQADINTGKVTNQATATAKTPTGTTVTDNSDSATPGPANNAATETPLSAAPQIGLVKTSAGATDSNGDGAIDAGDTVVYSFIVHNLGNVTLSAIAVTDSKVSPITCPSPTLAPNANETCTAPAYTLTQADLDAGQVSNTAVAKGTAPDGSKVADNSDPVTPGLAANGPTITPLATSAKMTLVKSGTLVGPLAPGSVINYTFTVTNTGTVTIKNITLADVGATVSGGPAIASLAPGATDSATFTASHTLTAGDIAAGSYTNSATATGNPMPVSSPQITANGSVTTALGFNAAMTFTKSGVLANPGPPPKAGDIVNYSLTVTNTGDVPLHNVTVTDPMLASNAVMLQRDIALLEGVSKPGAEQFATASIGHDNPQSGIVAAAERAAFNKAAAPPQVNSGLITQRSLVRMSGNSGPLQSGEKIGFLFTLTNSGDVPLTDINIAQPDSFAFGSELGLLNPKVTDGASIIFTRDLSPEEALAGEVNSNAYVLYHVQGREVLATVSDALPLSGIKTYDDVATASISPPSWPTLNPGEFHTFTAPYVLNQADIDAGVVNNTAQASADDPANNTLLKTASATVPLTQAPKIGVVKTGILTMANGVSPQVGDVITYHFAITNLGNVTLTNVTLQDAPLTLIGAPIPTLAPGVTNNSYTAQYVITQPDINAGKYDNQATVSGTPPTGPVTTALSDFADPNQHRITTVPLAPTPAIALLKQVTNVTTHPNGLVMAGDVITYKFTVKNTGNLTLNNVVITDPMMNGVPNTITGGPLNNFAPGAIDAITFTGHYTITQADADKGNVTNTATVTGTPPSGPNVTDQSDPSVFTANAPTITPIPQAPKVTLVKTVASITDTNNDKINDAGDVIHYAFQVQNAGNVSLKNFQMVDLLAGAAVAVGNPSLQLTPGQVDTTTFTATYTITTQDETNGSVSNQARVTADSQTQTAAATALSDVSNPNSNNPQPTVTPIQPTPTISVILAPPAWADTNSDGIVNAGDILTYQVKVKNTGAVPLTSITVTDTNPLVTLTGTISGTLASGVEDSTSITATHVLTAADVTAGFFDTQVKATGTTSPGSLIVQDLSDPTDYTKNAPTHFAVGASPALTVLKSFSHFENAVGATVTVPVPGGKVVYAVSLKNTGNVDFTDETLTEVVPYTGTINGSHPWPLMAGATDTTHFTVSQVLTSADILIGHIDNQLSAVGVNVTKGNSPADLSDPSLYTGNSPTIVPLSALPAIAVIKTATVQDVNGNGANDTGDVIHYAFSVVNTGNVDLTNVTLTDANATLAGGPIPLLAAGATNIVTFTATYTVQAADVTAGHYDNQATAKGIWNPATPLTSFVTGDSDFASLTANPKRPTVVQLSAAKPVLTKTAARSQVKRGEVVPYTITATNVGSGPFTIADIMPPGFGYVSGSAIANGSAVAPVINGQTLTFNGLMSSASKITLTLNLLASTTSGGGKFINNARLIDPGTGQVIGVAQATVEVIPEAVFDCSDIIGRVFDDLNSNGYMDDGEPGLPGVRLATLNGVLITTDADGKYHVPCAAIPDAAIGSNFLLKLDTRTLPTGYHVTSENPRDVRVTRGKVTVLNFGAAVLHEVKVDLISKAFDPGTADLTERWSLGVDKLIKIMRKRKSALTLIYHQGGESSELAQARVEAVAALVKDAWAGAGGAYPLTIKTSVEEGQQ